MKNIIISDNYKNKYIYNDDTGMIFNYSDDLINILDNNKKEVSKKYNNEYFLDLKEFINNNTIYSKINLDNIKNHLEINGFNQLTLKVTDQCNMRCKYCIFSDHYPETPSYMNNFMAIETAKSAIDIFMENFLKAYRVNNSKSCIIGFYGGEPLLAFDVIKNSVEYAKQKYPYIDINFSITTNGLLLENKEIRDFLKNENFWISLSFDGYKENHDRNRVDINNKPTYTKIVEIIKSHFSDYESIFTLCCIDYRTNLYVLDDFFEKNEIRKGGFIPRLIRVSRINASFTDYYDNFTDCEIDAHFIQYDNLNNLFKENMINGKESSILSESLYSANYLKVHERSKFFVNNGLYICSSGNCVPGDKLYVETNGDFKICEKVNTSGLEIGNVSSGFNFENAKKAIFRYNENIVSKCKDCSYSRLCSTCYSTIRTEPELSFETENECENKINWMRKTLTDYLTVENGNPGFIESRYINSFKKKILGEKEAINAEI